MTNTTQIFLSKTSTRTWYFPRAPKFTLSHFPTSHPTPSKSGTSQGQGDQIQALVHGRNIIYN